MTLPSTHFRIYRVTEPNHKHLRAVPRKRGGF